MQTYLKLVGNGQKSARAFTREEAREVMELIATQQATPAQLAALMAILRFKEETSAELVGFAEGLQSHIQRVDTALPHLVDIGVPYDGRSKSPSLILAAACIVAACGVQVALHGRTGLNTPPKFGVGVGDILQGLGIYPYLPLTQARQLLEDETVGLAYVDSSQFAPALEKFNAVRLEYGMRSFVNTVEKLLNPFNAPNALIGIFHGNVQSRVAEVVQGLGYQRGIVVQGPEGAVDILPGRRSPLVEVNQNQQLTEWQIDPAEFGGWHKSQTETAPVTPKSNAELTEQLLIPVTGDLEIYQRGALMTAALLIYLAGKAATFAAGLEMAQDRLLSGAAQTHLTALQKVSQQLIEHP